MGRERTGLRFDVQGIVQGVGFRPWVFRLAREHGLTGRVWNHARGVTIEAFGPPDALECFAHALRTETPPAARVDSLLATDLPAPPPATFDIVASEGAESVQVSIPPDLKTCDACLAEIADAGARRHRYAFTNCTNCGPRFTIALGVPYDRPATTMAAFQMCEACRSEYMSPDDRRFHAQPIACPQCGPRLRLTDRAGRDLAAPDPIDAAAALLREGAIVAVKGLGGYLLACDATSDGAVQTLRSRKRREEKPFAVMVACLDQAERLARLTQDERTLLTSVEAPIVLCAARPGNGLAQAVAPDTPLVGLFLAYSPLHRLLLDAAGRPLVMTSGNVSDEPLAHRDEDAFARLAPLADAFLTHDRGIAAPCDDSVARVVAGAPVVMRRARGYVPRATALRAPVGQPVLACGALLKNTFCLASGDRAWLGSHVGDLDTLATTTFFEDSIARLEAFTRVRPEVFAHDLHPDLHSTLYARGRGGDAAVAVQHHHAHVAAVMAEHHLEGPVIGLAYDGTGYGPDGAAWGGEVLLATAEGYERLATFRPIPLAGGDRATVEVWRLALALVLDALGERAPLDALRVIAGRPTATSDVVRRMIAAGVNTPLAHGVGRYFDAAGALGLDRPVSHYEGQVAIAWNHAAATLEGAAPYAFDVDSSRPTPWIDLREGVAEMVRDVLRRVPISSVAARFHQTIVEASVEAVGRAAATHGRRPLVLGGGCFQNPLLTEGVLRRLGGRFDVWLARQVPPGDGGIALGQVLVAASRAR